MNLARFESVDRYTKAVELLNGCADCTNAEVKALKVVCLQNMALVHNKYDKYAEAVESSTQALEVNEKSAKAYSIRSKAYKGLREYKKALAD